MVLTGKEMTKFLEELQEELNEKGIEVYGELNDEEVIFDWEILNDDIVRLWELDGDYVEYNKIVVFEDKGLLILEFCDIEKTKFESVWANNNSKVFKRWNEKERL